MFIQIDLISDNSTDQNKLPISYSELRDVIDSCYLGLGTPYAPIDADNFIVLEEDKFPVIRARTTINIRIVPSKGGDKDFDLGEPRLVCCKVTNVGRKFNEKNKLATGNWKKVFKNKQDALSIAPDGTLYVAPNKDGACIIETRKKFPDTLVAYSVIFSLKITHSDGFERRYYFVLDPVVRISSNPPGQTERA